MRKSEALKNNFKFKKYLIGEFDRQAVLPEFDDSDWRVVSVPHDWGIEGDFAPDNDVSYAQIYEDGILNKIIHTGRTGALPTVGEGVYRKWVELDDIETVVLELDGVMCQSEVYVNGRLAGSCHFGYMSYELDITKLVKKGKNLIAIRAVVPPSSSRWYSGAGLYRNIRLINKPHSHICYNGVWVRQIYANFKSALFDITVTAKGANGFSAKITDPKGECFCLSSEDNQMSLYLENPMLWDIDSPNLYSAEITLDSGDSLTVRFGVRSCEFTKNGFFLNGRYLKMNGVCMHHDMGSIGAAVNRSALLRQIEIMKGMGVNAIRTSHNPPAPEFLDLCDEQGILVIDEFFDEWERPKVENGYKKYFQENALLDIESVICRDRNHPSVIMWSIGNEIGEQLDPNGWKLARLLSDTAHRLDPTRPTTAGCDKYPHLINNRFAFYVDVVGLNYKPQLYNELKEIYPDMLLLGSETASCISTRGVYDLPAEVNIGLPKNKELTVSDYGLCAPAWAYYAEREWSAQKDCEFVMGEFVWTGFDYLGEPTPYYTEWPSRSSYFGAVDLAGLPKNRYYGYRAAWRNIPTLHIFPHWNWEGREGHTVPVHIYTNYEEVELFINGVSQGKKKHAVGGNDALSQLERFRLMWNDTVYIPGEVCAVAYQGGKEVARKTIRTADIPHHIELTAYSEFISADGESLNYITASIVDKDGILCPNANNRLSFSSVGSADVYATDAGDQRETECFLRSDKKALSGKLVCCLKNNGTKGTATVYCSSDGLASASISFECR
ncbi:MAG: glycoside hydrolase family 2 protein [Ruminococcaceae bacterium]|nr:glycoside hydrolase family 2 protein [Oscillospiraceae bacterium]